MSWYGDHEVTFGYDVVFSQPAFHFRPIVARFYMLAGNEQDTCTLYRFNPETRNIFKKDIRLHINCGICFYMYFCL